MKKNFLLFLFISFCLPMVVIAQNKTIKGQINDDAGAGIADVTVSLKNSTLKAITDAAGRFSMSVPSANKKIELVKLSLKG